MGTKRWELNIQMLINYTLDSATPEGRNLRFQADEIKDHFPSLAPIIENMQKNSIRATKTRATIYSNVINLSHSHRE